MLNHRNRNIPMTYFTPLLNPCLRAEALRQAGSPLKRERTFLLPTLGEACLQAGDEVKL